MNAKPFDLVIWDCDGCLVDSEGIACAFAAENLTKLGYEIGPEAFIAKFAGCGFKSIFETILAETGVDYAPVYPMDEAREILNQRFSEQLKPIPGVIDALEAMALPCCVASGSSPPRVRHSLEVTGLRRFFGDNVLSASEVEHGKPAPDLFLLAAQRMGADPTRCLVIEDSVYGIQAGQAAGMATYAFLGASHITPAWRARVESLKPDWIFTDMRDLAPKAARG